MNLVLRAVHSKAKRKPCGSAGISEHLPYSHALLNVCRCHTIAKANNKLCNLLDVNHILVLFVRAFLSLDCAERIYRTGTLRLHGIHGNNLRATGNLKGMFLAHSLAIRGEIPEVRGGEACVRLLHACYGMSHGTKTERRPHTEFLIDTFLDLLDIVVYLLETVGIWSLTLDTWSGLSGSAAAERYEHRS